MKSLSRLVLATLILVLLSASLAFAAPSDPPGDVRVKLNDTFLVFDVDPVILNDRTMVPMRGIFEALGAQVWWYPETREVVGYKNNHYIKLQINNETYYKNGKSALLDSPPIILSDRTLVPIRFIAESLDMEVAWDGEARIVTVTSPEAADAYENFDGVFYRKVALPDLDLSFMIPSFWDESPLYDDVWEFQGFDTNMDLAVTAEPLKAGATLEDFAKAEKQALLDMYTASGLTFTGSDSLTVNNLDMEAAYLTLNGDGYELYQVVFYFLGEDRGYTLTFTYDSKTNEEDTLSTFTNIVGTVNLGSLSVSFSEEHYIEYDRFFEIGMELTEPVYSNMDVENSFAFRGYIDEGEDMDHFVVRVSKDGKTLESTIPVEGYEFDAPIHTPFGLGKHDVVVATPPDEDNYINYILQFSIINTSFDAIRYLVPSTYVNTDAPQITELADEIALSAGTDEDRALVMMEWLSNAIEYFPGNNGEAPQTALELLSSRQGDCDEISFLFASVLRNLEIPVRLMAGTLPDGTGHAWTEVQINGLWRVTDPTWGAGYINEGDGLYVKDFNPDYFDLSRTDYEGRFEEIEELMY